MNILGADFVAYQTHDIERAIAFYRDTLKLNMTFYGEDFGWAEFDVPPTTLAVYDPRKAADHEPNIGGGSLALAVEDVDETVQELKDQGVNIFAERIDSGVCSFALCTDPDGNMLWLHKRHDGTHG